MRTGIFRLTTMTFVLAITASVARAEVCITIDAAHDTLPQSDQAAAVLLVSRQLEQAGERVVPGDCARPYTLSHVRLGNTIVVRIAGPEGEREAIARGMDDLPAVYSQMAKSIVTGRPMTGLNVVDRTNVTASQATRRRVHTDSLWYARLGYGSLFGNDAYGTPALGFGYRAELDGFAIDVSFLNFQFSSADSSSSGAAAQTLLKLSGLYFSSPQANRSAYLGGGVSYGHQSFGGSYNPGTGYYTSNFDGSGLQGEVTAGYELARVTSLRVFVQADVVLPFYESTAETYPMMPARGVVVTPTIDRRRAPSLIVSLALGR